MGRLLDGGRAAFGLDVPQRAQWLRVLQLELSRVAAHLFTFGGHAATTRMYSPMFWGVADRDQLLDLFEELTGGRVYSITTSGGVPRRPGLSRPPWQDAGLHSSRAFRTTTCCSPTRCS